MDTAMTSTTPVAAQPEATQPGPALQGRQLSISYEARRISHELDVEIPRGRITAIIGPNACGKSTLLRALSRLLHPDAGQVVLDGKDIQRYSSKEVARRLGLLPQTSIAPFGITVADLVARGRYPHQRLLQQWSQADEAAVERAMAATSVTGLAERAVDELSGGQRQRVWIAMLLAQDTPIMLLDEPTTYLDIAHQLDVLELCRRLGAERRTLAIVLHDLNQACRFADHLIVMRDGAIVATGEPAEVMSAELLAEVFELRALVTEDPVFGTPLVIPIASRERSDEPADA